MPSAPDRPAVFLDRDGVINRAVWDPGAGAHESPHRPGDVTLETGALEGLRRLRELGWPLIVVSNQPAAAKQQATLDELRAVHDRVASLLDEEGLAPDDWRYCFHHPEGTDPALAGDCACRKPAPGMLLDAAAEHGVDLAASWFVGDVDGDIGAGRAAGVRTILVTNPRSAHKRSGEAGEDARAPDLAAAARIIVDRARR